VIPGARMPVSLNRDRHYLHVIGPNTPEIVGGLGGWLFDRVMAGWDVTAFVRDLHDVRPLGILGVRADDYGSAVASMEHCPGHRSLAVAAEVYDDDAAVRGLVREALNDRSCEVTIWGHVPAKEFGPRLSMMSHGLGPAAAAFKKHALAAAAEIPAPNSAGPEVFHSNSVRPTQRAMVHTRPHPMTTPGRGRILR
jgi:hypothetical protein